MHYKVYIARASIIVRARLLRCTYIYTYQSLRWSLLFMHRINIGFNHNFKRARCLYDCFMDWLMEMK